MTDQTVIERIQLILSARKIGWTEKKMFGGISIMLNDKFLIGYNKNGLLVRIDPQESVTLAKKNGAGYMVHGGKPQVGYLYVQSEGFSTDKELEFWIDKCLEYNPKAKAGKK